MKFSSSTYNVGYPVYGSKFLNDTMLLVAGGGGEGNNGIPNKLTVLRVDFEKKKVIKRFREITLDPNDDSPTTLDASNNLILMGCNENSEKIRSGGGNQNLRKFVYENEHLRFVASVDFDGSVSPEDYTKLIYMSRDGSVGAIASSKAPTVIRIIDPRSLEEKYEIETGHDVKDMHFAPDGKVIGYITASTLEVISIVTGRFIIRKNDFDKNYILSKVRFLTDDVVLIAASLQKGTGVVLIKISLKSGSATVLKSKLVTNKFKGLTSMDVDVKNQLAVIAGNDNSIALVKLKDFSLGRMFKQVHSFAITRVAFSPNSKFIASVSAANTVNVIKVPDGFALSTSLGSKVWRFFINFILIIIIAFLGQLSYRYNLHDRCYKFLKHQYLARRNGSTGGVDILKQTTLVGDIVSEVTSTKAPNTTAGKIESYSLEGRNIAVGSKADSSDDDVWLSDTWAGSASASYTGTVNTQVIHTTSFSASPMIDDSTTSNSNQVSESSVSVSETATTEASHSSSAAVTNPKVEREESIKHTESVSLKDSEKSRDERGNSNSKALTTSVAQSVRALEPDSLTQTHPESEHTSTPSKAESNSASFTEVAAGTSLLESLIDSQLEQTEKLQEPSQDPTAKRIGDATRTERAIEISSSTADDIRMTSVAREDEELKQELVTSSGNSIENSATTVVSFSSLALSSASNSQSKETALHAKQKSESSVTETGIPESLASSTATATKDESQIELPSGVEMNYDLLEEKTPEPTEILGVDEDLTTPTDDLISVQDSTESKAAAIPLEEESLETGKQDKTSKTASKVEESQVSTDDAMTSSRINELRVHIEKPAVPPTIIEASISNSESMVLDETEASQTSVDVTTSRNEVQTSLERLQDPPSTKHADGTVSLDNAEVSELPLEDSNEPVSTTSAKPSSTGESSSVTSSERGTNNVRKSHEWESSGQMSISTAHNEIAATEETSVVPEDAEYAISSNSQNAVVRDEL